LVLATSDEAIRARTGRGWQEWFDLLDGWGAPERSHREIARWVAEQQGIAPLAWNAQAVASSYERARGLRAVGEHPEGFSLEARRYPRRRLARQTARDRSNPERLAVDTASSGSRTPFWPRYCRNQQLRLLTVE
jgi:hypothetical protein